MTTAKARQFTELVFDAAAPTNTALTNPAVLARTFQTGGTSLLRGAGYMVSDIVKRDGRPLRVDTEAFTLGEDMTATEGRVVYRNGLIEVIQYAPQTPQVHATPLLICPPWINKYYIYDLGPGRSLVEWAVQQQRTVFAISYVNPDASMRETTFDDYLTDGIDVALEWSGRSPAPGRSTCSGSAWAGRCRRSRPRCWPAATITASPR